MDSDRLELAKRNAAQGNNEIFGEIYVEYYTLVYSTCLKVLSRRDDAEDVTSEVFLKLLSAVQWYDKEKASFECWLYMIAKNTAINFKKSRQLVFSELYDDPIDDIPSIDLGFESLLVADELRILLRKLTKTQRSAVFLCKIIGLAPNVAAAILGVPKSTVLRRLTMARNRIMSKN